MTSARRHLLRRGALLALAMVLCGAAPASAVCVGDCDGDGRVSIADLQSCVNRGSGLPAPACAAADQNNDGTVDANEVDLCVQSFLDADTCPTALPTPTLAIPTATNTHTPPPVPTATATVTSTHTVTQTPTLALPTPTFTATPLIIGSHSCTLANTSAIEIQLQAGGLSPVTPGGSLQIDCGAVGPDGQAACECEVNNFDDFAIPAVGDICITPVSGCSAGVIDCDGGSAVGAEFAGNHNIGSCTGDGDCEAKCDAYCADLGVQFARISYGCEGFCQGGTSDNMTCSNDTDCPGGQCVGANPPAHRNACNCACGGNGVGAAGAAGEMFCNIGVQITAQLPSDNNCATPGTVTNIILPPICAPVSTATSFGQIRNVNNASGTHKPASPDVMTGKGGPGCNALASSTTSGMQFVGHLGFNDSTIGDLFVKQTYTCQ